MSKHCIDSTVTIQRAMEEIDNVEPKIVFLTTDEKVVASLTDGDIRRYLLGGGRLSHLAIEAAQKNPAVAYNEKEAVALYDKGQYIAIPIVDSEGKILRIYIGEKGIQIPVVDLGIPVVINAGGKGTRLEPYTKILPKPLIPVGDLPIMEHIMQHFQKYGCTDFSVIVNYKKELIKAYFMENEEEYDIKWYNEERPLGTGGGLFYLKGKMDRTFIFTNCDNLLLSDYERIFEYHKKNKNIITMICANKEITIPYGVIKMNHNGNIEGMVEKPQYSFLTNTGIYIVEPEVLEDIEEEEIGFPDIIQKQLDKGKQVKAYSVSGDEWLDMGQLNELEIMQKRLYGE